LADKKESVKGSTVDSGTFSVLRDGKLVASERFSIEQGSDGSTTTGDFRLEGGGGPPVASFSMQLAANGNLVRYEWRGEGGKTLSTVEPGEQVLKQTITFAADKPVYKEYLLPPSAVILDDYTFVQRELLTWRYLATACKADAKGLSCPGAERYGALVPTAQVSFSVTEEFVGMEKITIRGQEKVLGHFVIKTES